MEIFSAEGDVLHQYADCVMMGALDHVDLWPAPDGVNKPVWTRQPENATYSREFQLPCSGDQLAGRNGVRDNKVSP